MKDSILSLIIFMVLMMNAHSQTAEDTIIIQKYGIGVRKYYQKGQIKTFPEIKSFLANNPASAPELYKYKVDNAITLSCCISGSFCMIVVLGKMISFQYIWGNESEILKFLIVGAALDITALSFGIAANKHIKKSVSRYNSSLKNVGLNSLQINLMINSNRIGIRMLF
jgi:hypothetical protein